jgi:hypothetical protein
MWRKSSRCGDSGQCVEIAFVPEGILVRDSKQPEATPLRFTRDEWDAFLSGVRGGEFDLAD